MNALSPEIEQAGAPDTLALAFRHPDSNFDPDFFIARLHINIADKIQSLRQERYPLYVFGYRCFAVAFRIERHWEAQVQLRFPAAD